MWQQAFAYRALGLSEQQISVLTQLSERFASATDPDVAKLVTQALYERAVCAYETGDGEQALPLFDAVIRRARGTTDRGLRSYSTWSALRAAGLLADHGATKDGLRVVDAAIYELKADEDRGDPSLWAQLLLVKAELLSPGRFNEALVVIDAVLDRFFDSADPEQREFSARALMFKMRIFNMLDQPDEALQAFEQLVNDGLEQAALTAIEAIERQRKGSHRPADRDILANYLILKATILYQLDHEGEARSVLADLVADLEHEQAPNIRRIVAHAREVQRAWSAD
jgi:hypothetical protein